MSVENSFWDKLKTGLDASLSSSKKVMNNARKKSRDLEEYSILKIDIRRLETRNSELFKDLGLKIFSTFFEEEKQSISVRSPLIRDVLEEIENNREMLKLKEEKLEKLGSETD